MERKFFSPPLLEKPKHSSNKYCIKCAFEYGNREFFLVVLLHKLKNV
ncbi:hypothetical protein THER_0756 [Thermodesulfovibrio sp. N1]|nr:hypothetical protein THER_0756 [Thermodesulfovibrio sp. N1]